MNSDTRIDQLKKWIKETLGVSKFTLAPVSGDASFRRYFRFKNGETQFIAVDAPPEKEKNSSFVSITHLLESEGLPVPHIYYSSLDFGFFLLDDFGDKLYLNILNNNNADKLYQHALDALIIIQQTPSHSLPKYDQTLLLQEMELFRDWFLKKHLSITLSDNEHIILNDAFAALSNNALIQPQVFVHRDYHSRNLLQINNKYPGIIDYQDAVCGAITYDIVSLLRDCYIKWPQRQVKAWALSYRDKIVNKNIINHVGDEIFLKWFDLMGIQRHLKAIGIFSRLNIRDEKPNYLKDIPLTLDYVKYISKMHSETKELSIFLENRVSL